MRATLFVGQAPGRTVAGPALSGRSGDRLARLVGAEHLAEVGDTTNLIDEYPGKNGKGDRFPVGLARVAARQLLGSDRHPQIVAVGLSVARALGAESKPLVVGTLDGRAILTIPHPSGVCRWWNDPTNVKAAAGSLRAFLTVDGAA